MLNVQLLDHEEGRIGGVVRELLAYGHVAVIDDAILEDSETLIITLTGTDNTLVTIAASPDNEATIDILDATTALLSIAGTTDGDETGTDGVFTVTQSAESVSDTVISLKYEGASTATNGTDFPAPTLSVTIPAGETTATIPVAVLDDTLVEGDETRVPPFLVKSV